MDEFEIKEYLESKVQSIKEYEYEGQDDWKYKNLGKGDAARPWRNTHKAHLSNKRKSAPGSRDARENPTDQEMQDYIKANKAEENTLMSLRNGEKFYVNPQPAIVARIAKKGGSYAVTAEGQILISNTEGLSYSWKELSSKFDVTENTVGVISKFGGGSNIIPGPAHSGTVLHKNSYKRQIAEINNSFKVLKQAYPQSGLKIYPPILKYLEVMHKAWSKYNFPYNEVTFNDFQDGKYKGVKGDAIIAQEKPKMLIKRDQDFRRALLITIDKAYKKRLLSPAQKMKAYKIYDNDDQSQIEKLARLLISSIRAEQPVDSKLLYAVCGEQAPPHMGGNPPKPGKDKDLIEPDIPTAPKPFLRDPEFEMRMKRLSQGW